MPNGVDEGVIAYSVYEDERCFTELRRLTFRTLKTRSLT